MKKIGEFVKTFLLLALGLFLVIVAPEVMMLLTFGLVVIIITVVFVITNESNSND